MTILIIGLFIFIGIHLIPTRPGFRDILVSWLGEMPYRGVFSLLVLGGLVLIVFGKSKAGYVDVWQPPGMTRLAPVFLMLPASVLLVAANFPNRIRHYLRHPMLIGTLLWALGHLLANGDSASILLFGSFACWSLYAMRSANRRGATTLQGPTPMKLDLLALVGGLLLYGLLLFFHGALFGVPLLP